MKAMEALSLEELELVSGGGLMTPEMWKKLQKTFVRSCMTFSGGKRPTNPLKQE